MKTISEDRYITYSEALRLADELMEQSGVRAFCRLCGKCRFGSYNRKNQHHLVRMLCPCHVILSVINGVVFPEVSFYKNPYMQLPTECNAVIHPRARDFALCLYDIRAISSPDKLKFSFRRRLWNDLTPKADEIKAVRELFDILCSHTIALKDQRAERFSPYSFLGWINNGLVAEISGKKSFKWIEQTASAKRLTYEEALAQIEAFVIESGIRRFCSDVCHGKCCGDCYKHKHACHLNEGRRLTCSVYICRELMRKLAVPLEVERNLDRLNGFIKRELIVAGTQDFYFRPIPAEVRAVFAIPESEVLPLLPDSAIRHQISQQLSKLDAVPWKE